MRGKNGEMEMQTEKAVNWAGALIQWLWEETHVPKVVFSNPNTMYWMDMFTHLILMFV